MPDPALSSPTRPPFPGFGLPEQNWFKMPNDWTDITAGMTSLAELKLVEYVLKHTWGYQEYGLAKRITTDEFMSGRKRRDGGRMDRGTGLSNRSVIDGLRRAVEDGYLIEEVDGTDKARIKKYYALRMNPQAENFPSSDGGHQADVKNLHSGLKKLPPAVNKLHSSSEESTQRTEQDTLARQSNNSSGKQERNEIVVALIGKGIGEEVAQRLASRYSPTRIFEKIDFLAYLQETQPQKVKSPHGWLRRAIEENYGSPDGYKSKAKREALAMTQKQGLQAQQRLANEREQRQRTLTQQKESARVKRLEMLRERYGTTEQEDDLWHQVLSTLREQTTEATFNTHLAQNVLLSVRHGQAFIAVPNRFIKKWVEGRLATPIQQVLARHLDEPEVVIQCQTLDEDE